MNEILIVGGQKKKQNVILEVDATRQSLGSTNLIDWSGNNTFSLVGSGAKIADVTGIGRVMDFTVGSSFFQTGGPVDLSTEPMIIHVIFQSINSSAIQMVWCTGDYSSRIVAGLGHYAAAAGRAQRPGRDPMNQSLTLAFLVAAGINSFQQMRQVTLFAVQ